MTRARDRNPVRLRREELGLTLKELDMLIRDPGPGATSKAPLLSMIEGGFVPKVVMQERIARALGTSAGELFPSEAQ